MAIGPVVVHYAQAAQAFSAGIECQHCSVADRRAAEAGSSSVCILLPGNLAHGASSLSASSNAQVLLSHDL